MTEDRSERADLAGELEQPPSMLTATDSEIRRALERANLPTLLLVLVHLTGETRFLEPPYRPTRARGMEDHDSGGFSEQVREEIIEHAVVALRDWREGRLQPKQVSPDQLCTMLSVSLAEEVPEGYAELLLEEIGLYPRFGELREPWPQEVGPEDGVVVIGAGLSGICAAIMLERAGVPYTLIEKQDIVGGTWGANRYPGCGVDTPSHLYSYSFDEYDWERYFASRAQVQEYLLHCAHKYDVMPNIRFGTSVDAMRYDEAACRWTLTLGTPTGGTSTYVARFVICAVGQLNVPKIPNIPGMDDFSRPAFHSADWPDGLSAVGQRIAIVGSGASAMQIVPAIADQAEELFIFQRSPQWMLPNPNLKRPIDTDTQLLMQQIPYYARWYRARLFYRFSDRNHESLQIDEQWPHLDRSLNAINEKHRVMMTDYITQQLGDRTDLMPSVVPDYPPFGKRMLLDAGWFDALKRANVSLITDPVVRLHDGRVFTAAGEYAVDAVVFATGFEALRMLQPMEIVGRSGRTLRDTWGDDDARAFLGITVPDFPNLFCLYGPNTNLAHGGSIAFHSECQVRYVLDLMRVALKSGWDEIEVRPEVHDAYNERVDAAHERMVWSHPAMETWYRNRHGRVVTNSPWRLVDYWTMTREPRLEDFQLRTRTAAEDEEKGTHDE